MNTYNVLMTVNQYIEVQANSAREAEDTAWEEYREGKHVVDAYPEFTCEECDRVDEDECEDDDDE